MLTIFTSLLGTDSNSTQPEPPLSVIFNGDTYILGSSDSVRQSADDENFDTDGSTSSVRVVTESVLDLESSQKATLCEVGLHDTSTRSN